MTIYYVSTTGSDSGIGSADSPWKTIDFAISHNLRPGDTVMVAPGTYNEAVNISHGGSAAGDVSLVSEVPGAALIRPGSSGYTAVNVNASYVTIKGFDIANAAGSGIGSANVHHVSVLDNTIHDNAESGVQLNYGEFFTVSGNTVYNNASSGWFSGISIYQARNISGDTSTPGYRIVISDNVSYDNVTKAGLHTDGNGIILDDFQNGQNGSTAGTYAYPALVDNNLLYGNGGKGIAVHWSDNVTVANNTAYHNNMDPKLDGTWQGELSNQDSNNNVWVNNIAVADPTFNNHNNTAIGYYGNNSNVKWVDNITYNGVAGDGSMRLDGGNPALKASDGNLLGVDPKFVNVAAHDFHLTSASPGLNAGTSSYGVTSTDLAGGQRVVGSAVDIGAYEFGTATGTGSGSTGGTGSGSTGGTGSGSTGGTGSGSTGGTGSVNHAPVAVNDSGFTTNDMTPLTITSAKLLANDSDPDGNHLTIAGVNSATGGTVALDKSGDVVFTPKSGFAGSAGFNYVVSDGNGGTDQAHVSVTVTDPPPVTTPGPTPSGITYEFFQSTDKPAVATDADTNSVELGMKFTVTQNGQIDALRFYKGADNTGTHTATLWTADGHELATVTFSHETAQGWQQATLSAPVDVHAGQSYVVSYHAPDGHYSVTEHDFTSSANVGPIEVDKNAGVYAYGSSSDFPDHTYRGSNYFVDVVFQPKDASNSSSTGSQQQSTAKPASSGAVQSATETTHSSHVAGSGTAQTDTTAGATAQPSSVSAPSHPGGTTGHTSHHHVSNVTDAGAIGQAPTADTSHTSSQLNGFVDTIALNAGSSAASGPTAAPASGNLGAPAFSATINTSIADPLSMHSHHGGNSAGPQTHWHTDTSAQTQIHDAHAVDTAHLHGVDDVSYLAMHHELTDTVHDMSW